MGVLSGKQEVLLLIISKIDSKIIGSIEISIKKIEYP